MLTLPNLWPAGSDDLLSELDKFIGLLCLPPDDCGVIVGQAQRFLDGDGNPACGPGAAAVPFGSCTGTYNATEDRFESCDDGDFQSLAIEVDLSAFPGFTIQRVQARLHYSSTRTDLSGGPCDQRIVVNGTQYDIFHVANSFLGEDVTILDTGLISEPGSVVRIETFVRDTLGSPTGFAYIEALAIEGTGVNPWSC